MITKILFTFASPIYQQAVYLLGIGVCVFSVSSNPIEHTSYINLLNLVLFTGLYLLVERIVLRHLHQNFVSINSYNNRRVLSSFDILLFSRLGIKEENKIQHSNAAEEKGVLENINVN